MKAVSALRSFSLLQGQPRNQFVRRFCADLRVTGQSSSLYPKPIILLDVDGVINFVGKSQWPNNKCARVFNKLHSREFAINWSPAVVDKLNHWSESGMAEIRWLTMWDESAPEFLAPALGIRHFELARNPLDGIEKNEAADRAALAEPGRPIVWIDDEVGDYARYVKSPWISKDSTLIINPKLEEGLTPQHLENIEAFLVGARENRFPSNEWKNKKQSF